MYKKTHVDIIHSFRNEKNAIYVGCVCRYTVCIYTQRTQKHNIHNMKSIRNSLMPSLQLAGETVLLGPIQRQRALKELYAMVQHFELPSWFILLTISPSDITSLP